MYICKDCGKTFEVPAVFREYHGLDYGYEELSECPYCKSGNYVEAKSCHACGEPIAEGKLCPECLEDLRTAFDGFLGIYATALDMSRNEVADLIMDFVG